MFLVAKGTSRLAIINADRCKPTKCNHECKKICPVVSQGKLCVEIEDIAKISTQLCTGCGLCEKKCPFNAINIVNLPSELGKDIFHCYGENAFRLYKFPIFKKGIVTGLLGPNGIGKSTIVNILSGKIKPNFNMATQLTDKEITRKIKNSENRKYFADLYSGKTKIITKSQDITSYKKSKKTFQQLLLELPNPIEDHDWIDKVIRELSLSKIANIPLNNLSGGQLHVVITSLCLLRKGDVYIFDEPCNYLDVKQRLAVSHLVKELSTPDNYVLVIEHDITILDYLANAIHILYGTAGAYGVSSLPYNTAEAINMFFSGYIRPEKMLFRAEEYSMSFNLDIMIENDSGLTYNYDQAQIKYPGFMLQIEEGQIPMQSSVILALGKNGTGKTTFLNYLAKTLGLRCSIKPQYFNEEFGDRNVRDFLSKIDIYDTVFRSQIIKPFKIDDLLDRNLADLSGGELQRVQIVKCLGTPADFYLLDEPSANLDVEYRILASRIIKRFLLNNEKVGLIIEHDITMALYLSKDCTSKVVLFREIQSNEQRQCLAGVPVDLDTGMNWFMRELGITMRSGKDRRNRINKKDSVADREQINSKKYYVV